MDVTPDWPIELAGFASRGGAVVDRVDGRIHLRALVLDQDGRRLCLLVADLLNWPRERVHEHRALVARLAGTSPEHVLLCGTHNHSGPQPNTTTLPSVGRPDPRYLELFTARLATAVTTAVAGLTEVSAVRDARPYGLGAQRRIRVGDAIEHGVNPDGPADPTLTVVGLCTTTGQPLATLLHYTCHAVVSAEDSLTGDYPGFAAQAVEEKTGGVALFLQGCCGDINPGSLAATSVNNAIRAGVRLADVALTALDDAAPVRPVALDTRHTTVPLPFAATPGTEELRSLADSSGLRGEWARTLLRHPGLRRSEATLRLHHHRVFEGVEVLAMNGEMCVEYGLLARELSSGAVLPVGYANGIVGYVPRAYQIREGGYEADESTLWYAMPGPFVPAIEQRIDTAIAQLLL